MTVALLCLTLATLAWFSRNDRSEYLSFTTLTDSATRQRFYRAWAVRSFLLFVGTSVVVLALLDRLDAIARLPVEFAGVAALLPTISRDVLEGALPGAVLGLAAVAIVARLRARKGKRTAVGDFEALLPRNRAERWWAVLLSVNAGVSEELYFRLLLPLMLTLVLDDALLGFAIATVIFGVVHLYQGWLGIVATTVLGGVLAAIYLATGELWIVIAIHAAIDLNAMLLQPLLRGGRHAVR